MKRLVPCLLAMVGLLTASAVFGASPQILDVGAQEIIPGGTGRLPHIATDTANQPHIVTDMGGSSINYFYHKIGASWSSSSFNSGGSQSYNPRIEINNNNQAWVSIVKWWPQGMGMFVMANMSTAPTILKYSGTTGGTGGLPVSNLSLDPTVNNKAVVYGGNGGWFEKVGWNGAAFVGEGVGTLDTGSGGEKNFFHVSRAGNVQHGGGGGGIFGNHAMWHSCSDWSYNNSLRKSNNRLPIHWANFGTYPGMGDDGCYPCIVGDSVEPQTAYMTMDLTQYSGQGLVVNIWKGSNSAGDGNLVFSRNGLLVVDPIGTSGLRRFEPQLCPAKDGGAWICYTAAGNIRVRHIPSDTTSAADLGPITQFPGGRGAICADSDGNLHVVYFNGGLCYRKLSVSGASSGFSLPADFDGDMAHDVCVVTSDMDWNYRLSSDQTKYTRRFGVAGDLPVPGKYQGGSNYNFAVWRASAGLFIVRKHDGTPTNHLLGVEGDTPVHGDFDNDGTDDYAVFTPSNGLWQIHASTAGNSTDNWGQQGDVPFAFDAYDPASGRSYDADDLPDKVVWRASDHNWHIKCSAGGTFTHYWGTTEDTPYPGDYDGDGEVDFASYRDSDQKWRILFSSNNTSRVQKWGVGGDTACPGSYETEDNKWDLSVFRGNTFHIERSSGGGKLGEPPVFLGNPNGTPVCGNYDNTTDVAIASFDPSSGWWTTGYRTGATSTHKWGIPGDEAVPMDYDSDGILDRAVYRDGWWFIRQSSGGSQTAKWGIPGDMPVPGDYNNDGDVQRAVFRGGWWFVRGAVAPVKWGIANDLPFPGQYDNDGILDLGVYRPSTGWWFMYGSESNTPIIVKCGVPGRDQPIPGDYDGDGLTDPAVFNAGGASWVYVSSASGYTTYGTQAFGTGSAGDIPAIADYDMDGNIDIGVVGGTTIGQWWAWLSSEGKLIEDPRVGIMFNTTGTPLGSR